MAHGRKIRVLQVSSACVYGGNEEHIRTLVKYLDRDRFDVLMAAPRRGEFAPVIEAMGTPVVDFQISGKWDFGARRRLITIVREQAVDLVHSHNRREDVVAALAARKCRCAAVTTVHDRINMTQDGTRSRGLSARLYSYILRHGFDRLIAVSEATRRDCIEEAGVSPEKVVHVVNGMDLERLRVPGDPAAKRKELGLASGDLVAGMVARVRGTHIGKKGHRYFLEAAASVGKELPASRFVIVGEDDDARRYLSGMAGELGILPQVVFLGYRKDVMEVLSTFDVIVLPSLFEGLPRTLMEGMALGKPAVGTHVDGIMELVTHGETGLLVEPRDSAALACAMRDLLSCPEKRARMGAAAAARIRDVFDGRAMARGAGQVYETVAGMNP